MSSIRARAAWPLGAGLLTVVVLAAACLGPATSRHPSERSDAWVTTSVGTAFMVPTPVEALPLPAVPTAAMAEIDASRRFQSIAGFGAALTDASALVIDGLGAARRDSLLSALYSPHDGLGLALVRVPLGASDYSPTHYTYDDVPAGQRDDALAHFSIAPDSARRLPMLRQLRARNPALRIVAAPWSAPAWMKTSQSLLQGTLRDDATAAYAEYLVRIVRAYQAAGAPIAALSVQNEPAFTPADYPGMRLSAAQRARLAGRELGPRLAAMPDAPMLLEWDHNWDHPEEPLTVLADDAARRAVRGVAWHCYGGQVAAQDSISTRYPNIDTWFTECSGGDWAQNFGDNLLWNTEHLIVGALNHGARGVMFWNLALNANHGPHLGGCTNCRGVITIEHDGSITRNVEYWVLAHAATAFPPGSQRIFFGGLPAGVQGVAALRPDRSIGIVAMNAGSQATPLAIRTPSHVARVVLPARSVATLVLR